MKKSNQIFFPVVHSNGLNLGSKWIKVSKHSNGWYVQEIFNKGANSGKIHIIKTKTKAIALAERLRRNY